MPALSPCPNRERLLALKRGDLEGDSLELVCQHLTDCPDCDHILEALEDADDEIVGNLRHFLNREPLIKREDCKRLEERAQAIPIDHLELLAPSPASSEDPPTTPREHEIPKRLGKYQLGRKLGRGGMGVVFAATHINLHRDVAIKVILPEYAGDPRILARFRREVKAVGKLKHENIVTATDAGDAEGHHFLVMELVDGLDLDALLKANGPLPVPDACEIIRQAALGLQYVHEQGGVHRDLKPSNLMLAADGTVKVLDLGLARIFSDRGTSAGLTFSSQVMGTEDYMAPEQWEDSGKVDIRADIYSLGCTLYKILTGDALYGGPEYKPLPKKKAAHRLLEPPSIRARRPEVSVGLAKVLERSLEKDREARFATPIELAEALAPFANGNDCRLLIANGKQLAAGIIPQAPGTPGTRPETVNSPRQVATPAQASARQFIALMARKRWPIAVAVVAAAACLVGAVAYSSGWGGNRPLEPGIPYKLLQERPKQLYWMDERFNHTLSYVRERQEVSADVPFVGLLGLGRVEYAGYRYQLGIRQTRWTGGVGLFFGYRETRHKGRPCIKYQVLEINRHHKGGFYIGRAVRTRYLDVTENAKEEAKEDAKENAKEKKKLAADNFGFASEVIGNLIDSEMYTLVIEVRPKGLSVVSWNGKPLPELVKAEHNAHFSEADYIGEFGTFSRRSTGVFGNSYIMLFGRSSQ